MLADAAAERLDQRSARALEPRAAQLGNLARVALAGNDRLEHANPAYPHRIGQHRGELDVGVLQDLVDPVLVANHFAHRLSPRSRQIAQLPDRSRRHEARRNQPVCQQIGNPGRIVHVALATRNVAHLLGIGQDQRKALIQHVPHRLPVNPGRLHRYVRDAQALQPIAQRHQLARRGAEPAHLLHHLATRKDPRACHHFGLVNVEASTASIENFHLHLLQQPIPNAAGARIWTTRSLPDVLGSRTGHPVRSLATLTGARQILRSNLTTGSRHQATPTFVPAAGDAKPVSWQHVRAPRACQLDRGASPNYTAAPWTDPRPYPDSVRAHAIYAERSPARALTRIRPSQL